VLVDISGKKKEYLKAKIVEHEINSKIKIPETYIEASMPPRKVTYQPRTNIAEGEKGNLVTESTEFWIGGGTISFYY
jgi:hypothetical protein